MMRGMRGMNQKQMMKKMGIKTEDIGDVTRVVIETPDKHYVLERPEVQLMVAQGQSIFTIAGDYDLVEPSTSAGAEEGMRIPREDIELVAGQAGVSEEEALEALKECNGEPAEAIIHLMGKR